MPDDSPPPQLAYSLKRVGRHPVLMVQFGAADPVAVCRLDHASSGDDLVGALNAHVVGQIAEPARHEPLIAQYELVLRAAIVVSSWLNELAASNSKMAKRIEEAHEVKLLREALRLWPDPVQ